MKGLQFRILTRECGLIEGQTVVVTAVSRLGDVGVSADLYEQAHYTHRLIPASLELIEGQEVNMDSRLGQDWLLFDRGDPVRPLYEKRIVPWTKDVLTWDYWAERGPDDPNENKVVA